MKFLLNVGAEKAGTTWLYDYFRSHPQFEAVGKELNILQRDDLVPRFYDVPGIDDLKWYFDFFNQKTKVTGDFTHYEGSTPNVFKLMSDGLEADIVPVYIMRDPIERAWSAWNMLGGGGFEMPAAAHFLLYSYLQCKYKETIQALDSVFDNTLYFFYEDFFKQENLDLICDALNIDHHPINEAVVNAGKYNREVPYQFKQLFGNTPKNNEAVKFIVERFDNVPWNLENYP